ncbi:hypothetical protein TB2_026319 [Malus domestica]
MLGTSGEAVSSMDIGGGWALAYKYSEKVGKDGKKTKEYQRVYLHQEGALESRRGSMLSVAGGPEMAQDSEYFQAYALVSQPSLISKRNQLSQHLREGKIETQETVVRSVCKDFLEPGVKRTLFVGVAIQILQQFSGINS